MLPPVMETGLAASPVFTGTEATVGFAGSASLGGVSRRYSFLASVPPPSVAVVAAFGFVTT